jgi:hypothetical protein
MVLPALVSTLVARALQGWYNTWDYISLAPVSYQFWYQVYYTCPKPDKNSLVDPRPGCYESFLNYPILEFLWIFQKKYPTKQIAQIMCQNPPCLLLWGALIIKSEIVKSEIDV